MVSHWAPQSITYEVVKSGVKLVLITFEPCHLWMRWTITEPEEHIIPIYSRGIYMHSDKRFCFVVFEDNEQIEWGDTYIHTFIKTAWAHCVTRYFYFFGTMASLSSPSTTAIFKYHRVVPEYWFIVQEPWSVDSSVPTFNGVVLEPWTTFIAIPELTRTILDMWPGGEQVPPTGWVFFEPWGTSLTENNPWEILADPDPPLINLTDGILTLTFTNTIHSGIKCNIAPGQIPLQSATGQPLYILTNNPESQQGSPFQNIVNMVLLKKEAQIILLYLTIERSSVGWGSGDYGFQWWEGQYTAWTYVGPGPHNVDLLAFFQQAAIDFGFTPDPTGWYAERLEIAHRSIAPIPPSYLKNDYICLYHPE